MFDERREQLRKEYKHLTGARLQEILALCPMQVIDLNNAVLSYVRFGLWDHAFDSSTPANVLNGTTEATNFVGSDTRRFYLRIYDPADNKNPAVAETITVDWYTQTSTGSDDDHPGYSGEDGDDTITLTETGPNTGVFVSKGLMLVADNIDNAQTTDPGSGNSGGAYQDTNHRLRRAALGDKMCFSYSPTGSPTSTCTMPVFGSSASPDPVKTMTVQIANLRLGKGSSSYPNGTSLQTDAYVSAIESSVAARYAVAGIKVNFKYQFLANGFNDAISVPASSGIDLVRRGKGAGIQ